MGFMGTFYPGMKVNPLDLSPNYAGRFHFHLFFVLCVFPILNSIQFTGTLMAITNGIGAITGILSPYIVGVMTPNVSFFFVSFGY